MSQKRTLSVHTEHEFLLRLEQAGMIEEDAQLMIGSRKNKLASDFLTWLRNGGQVSQEVTLTTAPNLKSWERIRWTVQIGTFSHFHELTVAIEAKGYKIDGYVRENLLPKIPLAVEPSTVELFEVCPRDLGFSDWVRGDTFYVAAGKAGFVPVEQEVSLQFLLQFGHELVIGEWRVIASEPIVDSSGDRDLLRVGRDVDGVWLNWDSGDPDNEWDPDDRFLFRRKSFHYLPPRICQEW